MSSPPDAARPSRARLGLDALHTALDRIEATTTSLLRVLDEERSSWNGDLRAVSDELGPVCRESLDRMARILSALESTLGVTPTNPRRPDAPSPEQDDGPRY